MGVNLQTRRVRNQIKVPGGAVSVFKLHVVYCNVFSLPSGARISGLSVVAIGSCVLACWGEGAGSPCRAIGPKRPGVA